MNNSNLEIGQRIYVFEIKDNWGGFWQVGGWYAEKHDNKWGKNDFGRDMVSDNPPKEFIPHHNIINQHVKKGMIKVGTLVIKSIKNQS